MLSQKDFLDRVTQLRQEIRNLSSDIDQIGQLHQRTLGSADDGVAKQQLDNLVTATQARNTSIRDGIKGLERDFARDSAQKTKATQLESLKTYFRSELDRFRAVENEYRQKYKEQIGRQYRIVNPDASDAEVQQAVDADWGDEGVFQTALKSNRSGQAMSLLGNVRARHTELQRIENTLVQLSQMYQDLASHVEQQDYAVANAEEATDNTRTRIEDANTQLTGAVDHARRARKLKWWCFGICVAIVAILAIALGVALRPKN